MSGVSALGENQEMTIIEKISEEISGDKNIRTIAIDGRACSGKSVLAEKLAVKLEAQLIHMDDFFVPFGEREYRNLGLPMPNLDWERLKNQILLPVQDTVPYIRFDCSTGNFVDKGKVNKKKIMIIEGVSSLRDELQSFIDYSIFLMVEKDVQRTRLLEREPESRLEKWFSEWLPMEEEYFTSIHPENRADLVTSL